MRPFYKHFLLFTLLAVAAGLVTGCGAQAPAQPEHGHPMAPLEQFPADIQQAPAAVREAYQFAVANPDLVQQLPCYCGCGDIGHTSNYACYVAGSDDKGLKYDAHALGCSICVDITQDAMRLWDDGRSLEEIRAYVDRTYSRYGPSNMP